MCNDNAFRFRLTKNRNGLLHRTTFQSIWVAMKCACVGVCANCFRHFTRWDTFYWCDNKKTAADRDEVWALKHEHKIGSSCEDEITKNSTWDHERYAAPSPVRTNFDAVCVCVVALNAAWARWIRNMIGFMLVLTAKIHRFKNFHSPRLCIARGVWYERSQHSSLFAHSFAWWLDQMSLLLTRKHYTQAHRHVRGKKSHVVFHSALRLDDVDWAWDDCGKRKRFGGSGSCLGAKIQNWIRSCRCTWLRLGRRRLKL